MNEWIKVPKASATFFEGLVVRNSHNAFACTR